MLAKLPAVPCFCALLLGLATPAALGQIAPLLSHDAAVAVDSGSVSNTGAAPAVVFVDVIHVPDAAWLRLNFDVVELGGDLAAGTESFLAITSLKDGYWQYLHARHVAQWQNTSAYFNGDAVQIELIAYPGTGPNRVALTRVTAGEWGAGGPDSICDGQDNRVLSYDPRACRVMSIGCTGWLITDYNNCLLTAGHCTGNEVAEFNVPLSTSGGAIVHPHPKDQYARDPASNQGLNGGVGNDWRYYGVVPNSNTGLTPIEAQLAAFDVVMPPTSGNIRITGYGTVSSPVSPTWNQVQKTHVGPLYSFGGTTVRYRTDTTGGNSGSPIIWEEQNQAVGIHTHGGCSTSPTSSNAGTGSNHSGLQAALANPMGICRPTLALAVTPAEELHGWGAVGGPFAPNTLTYTLRNTGAQPLDYQVAAAQAWISLTNAAGSIPANATIQVAASINAIANALPEGLHTADITFTNTTNHQGDAVRTARLHVGGPEKIYGWNMDTDPGWTRQGQWAWGVPAGQGGDHGYPDPTAGYTGQQVFGYNLQGDYANNLSEQHCTTLAVDCSDLTQVWLHFWRWLGVEGARGIDRAYIRVSNDGANWTTIWQNPDKPVTDRGWVFQDFDISAVAEHQATVYVRWTMGTTDTIWTYCGWNLDDVEIWGVPDGGLRPGDLNCDGHVDFDDINPFVLALTDPAGYAIAYPNCNILNGDCNGDGLVNFDDINPFVALLAQ
ncbi:MAG: hypothetical protein AB1716_16040 [Planctomycetota bacterium]